MVTWVVRRHSALSALWPGIFPLNQCCFALFGQGAVRGPCIHNSAAKTTLGAWRWAHPYRPISFRHGMCSKYISQDFMCLMYDGKKNTSSGLIGRNLRFDLSYVCHSDDLSSRQAYLLYCSLWTMLERIINMLIIYLAFIRKFNQNHTSLLHGHSQ